MLSPTAMSLTIPAALAAIILAALSALLFRFIANVYWHPLSRFPGPWYAAATSLTSALVSYQRRESEWVLGLVRKYGTARPIRIAPEMLLFPRPSALRDIYWDPASNFKSELYGTGVLGPPQLFTTRDGERHRRLRKALGGAQWSVGALRKTWEPRFDDLISELTERLGQLADRGDEIDLTAKLAQFAAEIMTLVSFTKTWGFVRNDRDERGLLQSWRQGLDFLSISGRWRWFRRNVLGYPRLALFFLPKMTDRSGMGYLYAQADLEVSGREKQMEKEGAAFGLDQEGKDYLQYCLDARDEAGDPLTPLEKRAHVTLLIQAGADTTATAMGSTMRYLLQHPAAWAKCLTEIESADEAGLLSIPIAYEESRRHLPYFGACIKESLRLDPPATSLFARVTPPTPAIKIIDGHPVPAQTEVTTLAYVVQRDPALYAPDPLAFRPERWLDATPSQLAAMDAAQFTFGVGPRVCLGKEIALMELGKLLPELARRFTMELRSPGRYIVAGGVAYNQDLRVRLRRRTSEDY